MSIPTLEQRMAVRDRPIGRPVMKQRWAGLLFLHWEIDPDLIATRLPEGLHVDLYQDKAWIGIVPFFMQRVRPIGIPPLPGISWFLELNVRTYVHDNAGNPGVWFFSLDCNQPLAVEIARRTFHLPYEHAEMKAHNSAGKIRYYSRRRTPSSTGSDFTYQLPTFAKPAEPGSLEWFLVERYLLFSTRRNGGLYCGQVHHQPYQIENGICTRWSAETLALDGFPLPATPPESILTAAPVDVLIHPLRRLS